jgi:hypothetical protein
MAERVTPTVVPPYIASCVPTFLVFCPTMSSSIVLPCSLCPSRVSRSWLQRHWLSPRHATPPPVVAPHRLSTSRVHRRRLHPLKSQNSNLVGNNCRCVAPPVPPPCSSTVELPAALLNPAPLTTRKGGGSRVHTLHDGYWRTMGSSASVRWRAGGRMMMTVM